MTKLVVDQRVLVPLLILVCTQLQHLREVFIRREAKQHLCAEKKNVNQKKAPNREERRKVWGAVNGMRVTYILVEF